VKHCPRGFSLVEVSIVLVISGLLLSGVLKGRELIHSARVSNFIAQQEAVRVAFYGFQDRYRAVPGDYVAASANVGCTGGCLDGNGNGRIEANASGPVQHEEILVWTHLSGAGFLNASFTMASAGVSAPDDSNTPRSAYGVHLQFVYDANWGAAGNTRSQFNLKTGNQVPVAVAAEVDRKIDDGLPYSGAFQFSAYVPAGGGTAPDPAKCVSGGAWNIAGKDDNCGAAGLI
jgi:prepilin-type N-terminal cleavage/methylation domain-containing protein